MMRSRPVPIAIAVAAAALLSGCGPTPRETASAAMLLAPAVYGLSALWLALVAWGWRRWVAPDIRVTWRAWRMGLLWHLPGIALFIALGPTVGVWEYVMLGFILIGGLHGAWTLLVWRVLFAVRRAQSWSWAPQIASVLVFAPILPVALGVDSKSLTHASISYWMFGSLVGGTLGIMLAVLAIEVAFRGVKKRMRERPHATVPALQPRPDEAVPEKENP